MYKTCFLVKGEYSVHTLTRTQIVTLHLLFKPHTQQCAQTQSLVTFNTKISGQTPFRKKKKTFNGIVLLSILTLGI